MRRLLLFIPFVLFIGLGIFLYKGLGMDPAARPSALLNQPLPEFTLPRLDNANLQITRDDLIGEVFLLNVWGSWCPTCYQEHDQIIRLSQAGISVVGLNYKDERPKAFRYLQQLGNPYILNLFEPDGVRALAFDLGVYGAPETFLIDKKGIIRYHLSGEITSQLVNETILPEALKWQNAY